MIDWARFTAVYSAQIACVIAVAALAAWAMRAPSPRVRLVWWRGALVVCGLMAFWPARIVDARPGIAAVAARIVSAAPRSTALPMAARWPSVLLTVLVGGAIVRGAWLAIGTRRLRDLRKTAGAAPIGDALDELRRQIAPAADVRWHARIGQPVTFGVRRPVILLPLGLADASLDVQRAVVCHELVHAARHDWAWAVVEEAVRSVFWFHPPMRWALAQLQLAREAVVDRLSVSASGSRRAYLEALLAYADRPALAPTLAFAHRRQLVRRIALLTTEVEMSRQRIAASLAAASIATIGAAWASANAVPLRTAVRAQAAASQAVPKVTVISQRKPDYPPEALPYDVEAAVTVAVTIAPDGHVAEAHTAKWRLAFQHEIEDPSYWGSNPERPFADAAEGAALRWTFAPSDRSVTCMMEFGFRNRKDGEALSTSAPASTGVRFLEGTTVGGRKGGADR